MTRKFDSARKEGGRSLRLNAAGGTLFSCQPGAASEIVFSGHRGEGRSR